MKAQHRGTSSVKELELSTPGPGSPWLEPRALSPWGTSLCKHTQTLFPAGSGWRDPHALSRSGLTQNPIRGQTPSDGNTASDALGRQEGAPPSCRQPPPQTHSQHKRPDALPREEGCHHEANRQRHHTSARLGSGTLARGGRRPEETARVPRGRTVARGCAHATSPEASLELGRRCCYFLHLQTRKQNQMGRVTRLSPRGFK